MGYTLVKTALMAGRASDAEDVVQEAWLRAAGRLDAFEWRSALSTWLSAIVINCARERLRARPIRTIDPDAMEALPAAPAADAPTRIDVERALMTLPDGYREVLVLHDVQGYTHGEIATLLGIAPGTSKSQLFHARRAMRARLGASRHEAIEHAG